MSLELATLKGIWDFFSPLLSDRIKERLKGEPADIRAKKATFLLFEHLGHVRDTSTEFVNRLANLASTMQGNPTLAEQAFAKENLVEVMGRLESIMLHTPEAFRPLEPQIDVFVPTFKTEITKFIFDRSNPLPGPTKYQWKDIDALAQQPAEEFESLLERAIENQLRLDAAIEDFRSFLVASFTYKDSFS